MHSQANQKVEPSRIPTRFHQGAKAAAALVLVLGLAGFCGWVFNVAVLTSIRPTFASMKFNTSVLFLCLGAALWMSGNDERRRSVGTLSFSIAIVAGLTLAEYAFGTNLGIDQLFFRDTHTLVTAYPGRMAIATAACFMLLSLALLFRRLGKMSVLQSACALGCLAVALAALCGYLYGVESLYSIKPFSSMSLHTAIGFVAGCLAYFFARPNEGIMSVAASDSSAGFLLRTLVPTSVFFSIILGGLIVAGEKANLYETPFGVGLLVLGSMGCLTAVSMLIARSLQKIERERKRAEDGLRKSEERFFKAFRESPIAVTLISARDHRYLDVNANFERMTGWRRDEVIGRSALDLGICKDPAQKLEIVQRVLSDGVIRDLEFRFYRKDGTQRVGLSSSESIEIENEPCLLSVTADITERKQIEEKLHESEEKLRRIVSSAMDAVIAINEEQRVVLFNTAAEKMFGCSEDEAMGIAIDHFIPQPLRSEHRTHIQRFGESGISHRGMGIVGSLWGVRASGAKFPIEASVSHVVVDGKKLFTAIIRDITERRQAEEAIRESEERFRLVANTAPVMIWMSGTDKLCNYFNQPWLEFTGRALEAELGNGWADVSAPGRLQRCLDTYTQRSIDTSLSRWSIGFGDTMESTAGYSISACPDLIRTVLLPAI